MTTMELPINPPDEKSLPCCPECGEELGPWDKVYVDDKSGVYLGCTNCIEDMYADDYFAGDEQ